MYPKKILAFKNNTKKIWNITKNLTSKLQNLDLNLQKKIPPFDEKLLTPGKSKKLTNLADILPQ